MFFFPKVGYVSILEGMFVILADSFWILVSVPKLSLTNMWTYLQIHGVSHGKMWIASFQHINWVYQPSEVPIKKFHDMTSNPLILYIYIYLAIFGDLFEMAKWPFERLSDLQLGDKKVTLNHLVYIYI